MTTHMIKMHSENAAKIYKVHH